MSTLAFTALLAVMAFSLLLRTLNRRHLRRHGNTVPPELAGVVQAGTLRRMTAYTLESGRLALVRWIVGRILVIVFLFGGLLGMYDGWLADLPGSFVVAGMRFFLLLVWVEILVGIPFSLYGNFRVESRHGFNTMTGNCPPCCWQCSSARRSCWSSGAPGSGGCGYGASSWRSASS
jgi:STE24 endopeptidase